MNNTPIIENDNNDIDIDIDVFKNDVCKLTVIDKTKYIMKKTDVLSAVFFKSQNYYKNYGIYVSGLRKLMYLIDTIKTNYKLILFIDINVRNDKGLMNMIKKSKNTIPILFKCSKYMIDDKYHYDLFPTLVRFFPFFDFENNFTRNVIMVDIDLKHDDRNKLRSLIKIDSKITICAGDLSKLVYNNETPYLYAGMVSVKDHKYKNNIIINFIKNAEKIKTKGYYGKRLTTYGYGIDEIFLNDDLINRRDSYGVLIDYQISWFLYHSRDYLLHKKRRKNTYTILKTIIDKLQKLNINEYYYDKNDYFKDQLTSNNRIIPTDNMTVEEMIDFIDQNTYSIRKKNDVNNIISIAFYESVSFALNNNKMFLEKHVMDFICTYLLNIISCKIVAVIENNRIIRVEKYEIIYDSLR